MLNLTNGTQMDFALKEDVPKLFGRLQEGRFMVVMEYPHKWQRQQDDLTKLISEYHYSGFVRDNQCLELGLHRFQAG